MEEKDLYNKLIFKKYKILDLLGKGSFGYVFKGKNIIDKQYCAIKIEDWKNKGNLLESEAYYLFYLKGFGIPEVKSFGICGKYKVLVQTLLGSSLDDIFTRLYYKFTMKDICMIAIQIIERFEYIHSKFIIHRDIKPDNISVDYETNKILYLIDFGLSKKYRSSRTGKHIKFSIPNRLTGTARYASKNALRGKEQSRRDDLEAFGYVLLYFARQGNLPWMGLKALNKLEKYRQIYFIKKKITPENLCYGLPEEFCQYMKYVRGLIFEEQPNYRYLKELFMRIMIKIKEKYDGNFSWLKFNNNKKGNKNKYIEINNNKNINLFKRKDSPQSRLYRKLVNISRNNSQKVLIKQENKEEEIIKNIKTERNESGDDFILNLNKKIRKDTSNISDNCGTQLTLIDVSVDIDEDTIDAERNKSKKKILKNNSQKEISNLKVENIIKGKDIKEIKNKENNEINKNNENIDNNKNIENNKNNNNSKENKNIINNNNINLPIQFNPFEYSFGNCNFENSLAKNNLGNKDTKDSHIQKLDRINNFIDNNININQNNNIKNNKRGIIMNILINKQNNNKKNINIDEKIFKRNFSKNDIKNINNNNNIYSKVANDIKLKIKENKLNKTFSKKLYKKNYQNLNLNNEDINNMNNKNINLNNYLFGNINDDNNINNLNNLKLSNIKNKMELNTRTSANDIKNLKMLKNEINLKNTSKIPRSNRVNYSPLNNRVIQQSLYTNNNYINNIFEQSPKKTSLGPINTIYESYKIPIGPKKQFLYNKSNLIQINTEIPNKNLPISNIYRNINDDRNLYQRKINPKNSCSGINYNKDIKRSFKKKDSSNDKNINFNKNNINYSYGKEIKHDTNRIKKIIKIDENINNLKKVYIDRNTKKIDIKNIISNNTYINNNKNDYNVNIFYHNMKNKDNNHQYYIPKSDYNTENNCFQKLEMMRNKSVKFNFENNIRNNIYNI